MDTAAVVCILPGTQVLSHTDVDTAAHADEEACKQCNDGCGGSHGTQGCGTGKFSHHSHVCHIKQNLQQLGENQGDAEDQHIFGQRPFRHGDAAGAAGNLFCHRNSPFSSFRSFYIII